jgi:hypothetical protein
MPVDGNVDVDGDGDEDAGAMTIWATDFRISGLDDCSPDVTLSINRKGETPQLGQGSLTFTCDDPDTVAIEIYAWDNAFNPMALQPDGTIGGPNYDHCLTYVLVQDNMFDLCTPVSPAAIGGLIVTSENETVENVAVRLSGSAETQMITSTDGFYMFNALEVNADYTVTPIKNDDYVNGVSTFDLVLMTKHILGTKRLDSPYKLIAADANRSKKITALDLIQFRKLVLSVSTRLSNNSSWRFVPASYRFPVGDDPWAEEFPEILNYNDLQTAIVNGDFVAIKIGDVNNNAVPNSLVTQERSIAGQFSLTLEDQTLQPGNEYRVEFNTSELANIQGYQFTLDFDQSVLELVDMEYGVAKEEHFGLVHVEEGVVTTSWHSLMFEAGASNERLAFKSGDLNGQSGDLNGQSGDLNGQSGDLNERQLFTLVFRARAEGQLSDLLSVSSRYTQAEAYNNADELMEVSLVFEDHKDISDSVRLYQNVPNPFQEETVISFTLPETTGAVIKIHDLTGKVLKLIRSDYTAGTHQIKLKRNDLGATNAAILYYSLETSHFSATRKMVLVSE